MAYIGLLLIIIYVYTVIFKKKVKEVKTKESIKMWEKLPEGACKCILKYAQSLGQPQKWAKHSTDTFIKEVYYATTHDRLNGLLPISKMINTITETNKNRTTVKKFELDEASIVNENNVYVGMRRYYSNGDTNRVKYLLTNTNQGWKFNHITRDCKGRIVNKLAHVEKAIYVIETQGTFMLFSVPVKEDRFQMNEMVYVDGFLEVEDTYEDDFYYIVHTIMSIQ